jgi:hypothetical protein
MHIEYKGPIYPSQHSSQHLTIPQIERTRNGSQIKRALNYISIKYKKYYDR